MKKYIWTSNYRPFIMGGNVNAPIKCRVEVSGPYEIGKGYKAWLAISPNGKTFVAETETGAIIGNSIEDVRNDVLVGDDNVMTEQIQLAKETVKKAYIGLEEEFWHVLKG